MIFGVPHDFEPYQSINRFLFSAERLNLYLDRQEGEDEHEEEAVDETVKKKSRWKRVSCTVLFCVILLVLIDIV